METDERYHFIILKEKDEDFIAFLYDQAVLFVDHIICKNGHHHHYLVDIPEDMEEIDSTKKRLPRK
jgi:hypothetical protein